MLNQHEYSAILQRIFHFLPLETCITFVLHATPGFPIIFKVDEATDREDSPQAVQNVTVGFDTKEGILGCGNMEPGIFSVGEESVRPPDLSEHLVADAQLVLHLSIEGESWVVPKLPEVKVQSEVLQKKPIQL